MFERIHLQTIKKRINESRKFIQVILGPRQVGKTTMMTQLLSQIYPTRLNQLTQYPQPTQLGYYRFGKQPDCK